VAELAQPLLARLLAQAVVVAEAAGQQPFSERVAALAQAVVQAVVWAARVEVTVEAPQACWRPWVMTSHHPMAHAAQNQT
jgi:hypothetical protein